MDITRPENEGVLRYLDRDKSGRPALASRTSAPDPYQGCGCHPDIVERVWDQLGKALPRDCRYLVHGTPALVHPKSGCILATALGTQYAVRLPPAALTAGPPPTLKTRNRWSTGDELDVQQEFGTDWFFGGWSKQELAWCQQAFQHWTE